jgi:ABC-type spermidine/putrescine transport system permease subunit II
VGDRNGVGGPCQRRSRGDTRGRARLGLWVAAVATFLTLLAAFPLAYWLARYVSPAMRRPLLLLVILLPPIGPAIIAGALFAFTLSLDEFVITLF